MSKSGKKGREGKEVYRLRIINWFIIIICLLILIPTANAKEAADTIRVLLQDKASTVEFRVMDGYYHLIDASTGMVIAEARKGEKWSVSKEGLNYTLAREGQALNQVVVGPVLLKAQDISSVNIFRYRNIQYRGNLAIYNASSGLLAVNVLNIEQYLYGVLGKEIGSSVPAEALKAQAVVSRTYVLSNRGVSPYYDVGTDTSTQVYGGYDAELIPGIDGIRQAVKDTKGEVIYYEGQLIKAFFHANAGGHTESLENVWQGELPYLKAVSSSHDIHALNFPSQSSAGWPGNTYEWEKSFDINELEKLFITWNSSYPDDQIRIGNLLALKTYKENQQDPAKEARSGRVTRLDIIGTEGIKSFFKDRIRWVFGLKSTLFEIVSDASVTLINADKQLVAANSGVNFKVVTTGGRIVASNTGQEYYYVQGKEILKKIPKKFESMTLVGKGSGHGLGMSQWGARGMAEAGYNYQQIIEHYYNQDKNDGKLKITPLK